MTIAITGLGMERIIGGRWAAHLEQVEHVEARHAVLADISSLALDVLVAAAAESLVARAGQHHHAYLRAFATVAEGVEHLHIGFGAEGVVYLRTVDCYLGDSLELLEEDVVIFLDCFPVEHILVVLSVLEFVCHIVAQGVRACLRVDRHFEQNARRGV